MSYLNSVVVAVTALMALSLWAWATQAKQLGRKVAAFAARAARRAGAAEPRLRVETPGDPADTASRTNDLFLALLAHELRAPLTAVIGWLEVGRAHTDDPPTLRRALEIALRNAMQQAQMIDDLLDVSRIVSGKLDVERRALDLARLARDALDSWRPAAQQKHVELRCSVDEPVFIQGDRQRVLQAIGNLLGNAIKFSRPGGWVELKLERAQAHARLVVSDNGAGIAAEALERVFERFWQGAAPAGGSQRGLGLGLALVRGIVERHGGRVCADSEGLGRGARFTVELPALAGLPAAPVREPPPGDDSEPMLNGLAVVALDDDDDTLGWMQHLFAVHGAMTWMTRSAEEALVMVEREHADLLICGLAIGEGAQRLIERLRGHGLEKRTAVLAFSDQPTEDECKLALSAGCDGFVAKPCDPRVLLRAAQAAVHRSAP